MLDLNQIANPVVQEFIRSHENSDDAEIILRDKTVLNIPANVIARQIAGRRKVKDKLPTYFNTPGVIYPPSLNLEQSSSEATAQIKMDAVRKELSEMPLTGADLSGGFGVDSFFLAKICDSLEYVDPDFEVLEIARHNHHLLGASQIRHHPSTAQEFLHQTRNTFSFVFVDPSRRKGDQKVFRLHDCVPDIPKLLPEIFNKTSLLIIKTSPLMDLQQGSRELGGVRKIIIASVRNECREVLFFVGRFASDDPPIECFNVTSSGVTEQFSFTAAEEKLSKGLMAEPSEYLYEPNAAILKSGAFRLIGERFGLGKVHQNTHLYTSPDLSPEFPGRIFRVVALSPDVKKIEDYFPDRKANVITRNYPLTPQALQKKLKLRDGGDRYLLAFSGFAKKFTAVSVRLK